VEKANYPQPRDAQSEGLASSNRTGTFVPASTPNRALEDPDKPMEGGVGDGDAPRGVSERL